LLDSKILKTRFNPPRPMVEVVETGSVKQTGYQKASAGYPECSRSC